jgi:uncharacterized protein YqiB (DUF1249 family)
LKAKYRIDLSEQMASCEANYARLMKLLPDLDTADSRDFIVERGAGQPVQVRLEVCERCKYTTMIEISQQSPLLKWLPAPRFKLRVYHDVRMAEVIAYQRKHRLKPRYDYPNDSMFQPDEKAQLNRFLGEWLNNCLQYGRAQQEPLFVS